MSICKSLGRSRRRRTCSSYRWMKCTESFLMFSCCTTIDENVSISHHCSTQPSLLMSLTKNTSRGIKESHLKRETSIEKAAREANYPFRAVIPNQHFFKTVSVPFIMLAVHASLPSINTALQLYLIGSWTVSQTERRKAGFAWIRYDRECWCTGALHANTFQKRTLEI